MHRCGLCGERFKRKTELVHHDCPVRYADHMNRARARKAMRTHDAEAEVDGFRAWCKRCGKGYHKRSLLTNRGYCKSGCGVEVAAEMNRIQSEAAKAYWATAPR